MNIAPQQLYLSKMFVIANCIPLTQEHMNGDRIHFSKDKETINISSSWKDVIKVNTCQQKVTGGMKRYRANIMCILQDKDQCKWKFMPNSYNCSLVAST